jgi:hypothetical protein|tara:strand:+ start:119 stop:235 length:117 start_codon:yes stop_codon:yes gene_type:complete
MSPDIALPKKLSVNVGGASVKKDAVKRPRRYGARVEYV